MIQISLIATLLFITLCFSVVFLFRNWSVLEKRGRFDLIIFSGGYVLLLLGLIYVGWPISAYGRDQALQTIDEFMQA